VRAGSPAPTRFQKASWQVAVNIPVTEAEAALRTNVLLLGIWTVVALLLTAVGAAGSRASSRARCRAHRGRRRTWPRIASWIPCRRASWK
jgi:hypothetical protein